MWNNANLDIPDCNARVLYFDILRKLCLLLQQFCFLGHGLGFQSPCLGSMRAKTGLSGGHDYQGYGLMIGTNNFAFEAMVIIRMAKISQVVW